MPSLIWPRAMSSDAGTPAWIGRSIHWLGVALAVAVLLTAFGFAIDGWADSMAAWLTVIAIAVALGARGVRYLLAHE